MHTSLYKQTIKRSAIPYVISNHIYEYDLSKANITALLYANYLTKEDFNRYCNMEKRSREIAIGNLILKDENCGRLISEGICEAKYRLCKENHIQNQEVFEIRNDAMFILNRELRYTDFGIFHFSLKNIYNSFLNLNNIELFHGYNPITRMDTLDVKGIKDEIFIRHEKGWIPFFVDIFYFLENGLIENAIQYAKEIYEKLLLRKADLELYREFNSVSLFRIEGKISDYLMDVISTFEIPHISIKENILMLRVLISTLTTIYFQNIR